jgi:predicted ATP-dependent protease
VVEAVAAGQFHIYAIEHVDQGLELLTGLAASSADESVDTLERHVRQRLLDFAELRRRYAENKTGQPA